MLKFLSLAFKLLWREARGGEWLIIFFSLFLAVSATTSLHFYTDRLMQGFEQQSANFLGGDLVVSSATPIPESWMREAQHLQLHSAQVWSYLSMLTSQHGLQLVNLQAVSDDYPLLNKHFQPPASGSMSVEPRLLSLITSALKDSVSIGAKSFIIASILNNDIDKLTTGLIIAPRVMIRLSDVAATKTVWPASRVDYRLLITGNAKALKQFTDWISPQLKNNQRIISKESQQFELQQDLQLAQYFLDLILLICLVLTGVAVALSIRQYLSRHYKECALLRCLGTSSRQLSLLFIFKLSLIALLAGVAGIALGYLAQYAFAELFKNYFTFPLPQPSHKPFLLGLITSILLLFSFAYPIIRELPKTPVLYLWHHQVKTSSAHTLYYFLFSAGAFFIFFYWLAALSLFTLLFVTNLTLCIAVLYIISLTLIVFIRRILTHTDGIVRRGLSAMVQHADSVALQFVCFTLIMMMIMILSNVKHDFIAHWQESLPDKTPNYFIINIAPLDLAQLKLALSKQQVVTSGIYPIVRGRLATLNGHPIMTAIPYRARGHNVLHRQLNLTSSWYFPPDNKIVSGTAWQAQDDHQHLVSVEKTMADQLQLHLGDDLGFIIDEKNVLAKIVSIRTVSWRSFNPNFYFIFAPDMLNDVEPTYMTSFYLPPSATGFLNQLSQLFPNMTIIDVADLLKTIQAMVDKIIIAINTLFIFALIASVFIFFASIKASMDERIKTKRLLRILGASRNYIWGSLAVEFCTLFIIIWASAFSFARLITWILTSYFFK